MALGGGGGSAGATPADPTKARAMLQTAADRNSAEAQYQLGLMNEQGVGGPKDEAAARALFERAAAQNHPDALFRAGAFAESGTGGPQNKDAAKAYYEKAANLGNEDAKVALKRLQCPYVLKDKRGNIISHLCL
jgi:TPR repeat protein